MKISSKLKAESRRVGCAHHPPKNGNSYAFKIERFLASAGRRAWWLLGSRRLTICLLGGGALFYLGRIIALGYETAILSRGIEVWSGQGGDLPEAVARNWGVRAFLVLLLLNLSARLLDQARHGRRYSARGALGFWCGWTIRLGGLLFLFGLLVSMGSRSAREIYLGEGQSIALGPGGASWSGYSWVKPGDDAAGLQPWAEGLPEVSLQLERVDPGLDGDLRPRAGLLLSYSTRALVRYSTEAGEEGAQNLGFYPPHRLGGGYLFLTRFGFGPGVWIGNAEEKEIYQGFQLLELFPPGRQDSFTVPGLPYIFSLSLIDGLNRHDQEELLTPKDGKGLQKAPAIFTAKPSRGAIDPRHPVYRLRIVKREEVVYQGVVLPEQEVEFDGLRIGFPETRFWIGLGVVKDRGLLWAVVGLFLILSGLISTRVCRLLIGRKGPLISPGGERNRGQL